jgi:hypothetical protein
MVKDAVPDFMGKIQPLAAFFEDIHNPQRMLVVAETTSVPLACEDTGESFFSCMSKRGVTEVVAEGYCLGKVLV